MEKLRICVNTQTPLVQFLKPVPAADRIVRSRTPVDLTQLVEGVDYRYSPGGVTRMVLPLVQRLQSDGILGEVHWVSLNPAGPPTVRLPGIVLHNVSLPDPRMRSYGQTKEVIWGTVHGTAEGDGASEMFWSDDFAEFAYYNRRTAELIRQLDAAEDFDLFYIHDFQQLPIGAMLDTLKPKILRWHIPFDGAVIPDTWRPRITAYLDSYDAVVVSTRGYLAALRAFGYRGRGVRMYPYVDPDDYSRPSRATARAALARFGIVEPDKLALVVARMDPMKGQDRALRAFAALGRRCPDLKLVLVGNGSFSGSAQGLALTKSARWRASLEALARELGVAERVVFTGHVSQEELDAFLPGQFRTKYKSPYHRCPPIGQGEVMHSLQGVLTSFKITRKWQKISRGGNHGGTCIGRLFNLTTAQQEATSASRDAAVAADGLESQPRPCKTAFPMGRAMRTIICRDPSP